MESPGRDRIRLDRWLWAARFFKTRELATEAVEGGKVHLNGERVKPAHPVRPGDQVEIRRGVEQFEIRVRGLADRRGPAPEAQQLYEETAASRQRREAEAELRRLHLADAPRPSGRPDKRQRRRIIRFTGRS